MKYIIITIMFCILLAGCMITVEESPEGKKTSAGIINPVKVIEDIREPDTQTVVVKDDDVEIALEKIPDVKRQRTITETCDLEYPFECSRFLAKDGIIYLTIKNQMYDSKVDDVVMTLDGEDCDPTGGYMETGQNKEFECYSDDEFISAELIMDYYMPTTKTHRTSTGRLNILME
ncbi:hypothetical protein HQ545_02965 [Candidatus Woesearchaeota archaeon]|nr:hypothetical protein [Candidatus Woesearchaeota archaeon]